MDAAFCTIYSHGNLGVSFSLQKQILASPNPCKTYTSVYQLVPFHIRCWYLNIRLDCSHQLQLKFCSCLHPPVTSLGVTHNYLEFQVVFMVMLMICSERLENQFRQECISLHDWICLLLDLPSDIYLVPSISAIISPEALLRFRIPSWLLRTGFLSWWDVPTGQ